MTDTEPKYTLIAYKPSKEGFLRGGYLEGVEPSDLIQETNLSLAQLEDRMVKIELADDWYEIVLIAPTVEMPEELEWNLTERVRARVDARNKARKARIDAMEAARMEAVMAANEGLEGDRVRQETDRLRRMALIEKGFAESRTR